MPNSNVVFLKKKRFVVCFTGRRPKFLAGYNREKYADFHKELVLVLAEICNTSNRPVTFISGGAQGFDQLAFWAVESLKKNVTTDIRNTVYVPYKGQESLWKEEGIFGKKEYQEMLSVADKVVFLEEEELHDKERIAKALIARNHAMVDAAESVIALYNGTTWQNSSGGTAECIRYAVKRNKHLLQLHYS